MNSRIFMGVLTAILIGWTGLHAQNREFYKKPTNTPEYWKAIQFEVAVGKYNIAADLIRDLLKSEPKERDLLDIEAQDGLVVFLQLRNVERWAPDRAADLAARADVEKLIGLVTSALKKELSNPDRIAKFAGKLLANTPEERYFAVKELLRSGVDAMPTLLGIAQASPDPALRSAILETLPRFELSAVPPIVAALDTTDASFKSDLIDSLVKRPDFTALSSRVDTDIIPIMWYSAAPLKGNPDLIREKAFAVLKALLLRDPKNDRDKERTLPQWNLTEIARRFYDHKARFPSKDQMTIWRLDGNRLVSDDKSIADAEEYYGIRYLKWALEIQPDYDPAQRLFIQFILERHFARSGVDLPLARSAPALNAVIATAPYALLSELLESALRNDKVPTALVMIQAIADRAELKSARPSERTVNTAKGPGAGLRPSLLMKALDYPDRRVQFAAADALLRMPGPPTHYRTSQIVRILAGAIASEPEEKDSKPKVMIGDPDRTRSQSTADMMRKLGYDVEFATTGRGLVKRMQRNGEFELLIVDPHLADPLFPEFLAQARADLRVGSVPMVIVASGDEPATAHPLTLLARLAVLIAAQEQEEEIFAQRRTVQDSLRDDPARRFNDRLGRLRKAVESIGILVTRDVLDRLEYLTLLATSEGDLELPPEATKARLLLPPIERRARIALLKTKLSAPDALFLNQKELTPKLAALVARTEVDQPADVQLLTKLYWQALTQGQIAKDGKVIQEPLPALLLRHPEVEARLQYLTRTFKQIKIIPEVFTPQSLKEELQGFVYFQDPKSLEAAKRTDAKIAIDWLRKMAVGELPGYPYADAEAALRKALHSKDLAAQAIEAVARLGSREAQQDLASVVLVTGEESSPANRLSAADLLIKHIAQHGNMLSPPQIQMLSDMANTEANADIKGKLLSLQGIFSASAKSTGEKLLQFNPFPAGPPMPKEEEKKEEEKKEKE